MSKTKTALLASAACVVLGLALGLAGFARAGFDWLKLDNTVMKTQTVAITQPFSDLEVEGAECEIRLVPSPDGVCRVTSTADERIALTAQVEGDALVVARTDSRPWFHWFGIHFQTSSLTVALPQREYRRLSVVSASGGVRVPADFSFAQADVRTASGEIAYAARTGGALTLKTVSGDLSVSGATAQEAALTTASGELRLDGLRADRLTVSTTSGDLAADGLTVAGEAKLIAVSGGIELRNAVCGSLTVSTTSGDLETEDALVDGALNVSTVSGGVELERSDAGSLSLRTTSGDVSARLLTGKRFETATTSGSVRVPGDSAGAGTCQVRTVSGDVRIEIAAPAP